MSSPDFALLAQTSTLAELGRDGCLDGASATWSMWAGYLDTNSGRRVRKLLEECHVPLRVRHASGHASVNDLRRLAEAIAPRRVVPVHTAAPARYRGVVTPITELHQDGEWWEI